ncbi:MAG: FAD:protein FMN transferase [Thermoflexibacter sp.]|jgi:thiamine biosynthesis lipoprotein|nr:FAD:protein FMN transferase [Thermoflexibacter sp.]
METLLLCKIPFYKYYLWHLSLSILIIFLFDSLTFAQNRYEFSAGKLGTLCRIVIYTKDSTTANYLSQVAFAKIDSLNEIFSDYNENSELRKFLDTYQPNQPFAVSPLLYELISQSLYFSKLSDGAFDISIGSYSLLWRRARRQGIMPTAQQLKKAKQTLGYQKIVLSPHQQAICLSVKGMRLDVGGIGKGFIADKVVQLLAQYGASIVLVDLGGDISIGDAPPNEQGWHIEVGYKDVDKNFVSEVLVLKNCAIATSGDSFQYTEIEGKRYSHIINPRTGLGLTQSNQVTVIAQDGATADAFASALSVLGQKKGLALVRKLQGNEFKTLEAQIINYHKNRTIRKKSRGFQSFRKMP